jgi:hypothetical protein
VAEHLLPMLHAKTNSSAISSLGDSPLSRAIAKVKQA